MKNKAKNAALSIHFQSAIEKSQKEVKSIPVAHKCMTAHFTGLSTKGDGAKLV
jgi:hypothetical protein